MAVTIKDVAKETNLAISTISKYMNGGTVRAQNKKIIDETIKRLGYQPNKAARGLRSSRTFTVGLVLDNMGKQFFSIITENIEKLLKQRGYSMNVCCHWDNAKKAKQAIEFLVDKQVDGIIVVSVASEIDYIESARTNNIPVVAIDRFQKNLHCDSVTTNAAVGIYQAVEYLVQQGHEKIAIVTGTDPANPEFETGNERLNGYLRVFEDYCMNIRWNYIQKGDFTFASGYRCMLELWKIPDHPSAVITSNYNMTLGAVTAIHNMKIKMPDELSLIAFDDLEFSKISRPRLTAVRQPAESLAEESVKLLLRRVNGDYTDFPKHLKLPATFHIRDSVKRIK